MTKERKNRVNALIVKLKECQKECDDMAEEECKQEENCKGLDHAVICDENFDRYNMAISNIEDAIYYLEKIEE